MSWLFTVQGEIAFGAHGLVRRSCFRFADITLGALSPF